MKTLKFSDYISIKRQEYVFIKIIPHQSNRNYSSIQVCKTIAKLYSNLFKKIHKEQKKLIIETNFKFSYIIDMNKKDVSFIFITPKIYQNIVLEKLNESWNKSTFEILDSFQEFSKDSSYFKLDYKKEDALSLSTDKKLNEPLCSILSNVEMLKDDDRLTIVYNFLPENSLGWRERYDETMEKIKKNKVVDKPYPNSTYYVKVTLNCILGIMEMLLSLVNDFLGGKEADVKENVYQTMMKIINEQKELSYETKRKREESIIPTQIALVSHSQDNLRKRNTLLNCCHSFQVMDGDNEFIVNKANPFKITDYSIANNKNYLSCSEAAQLVQVPGKSLLNQFNINHISTQEIQIPEELRSGYICLGENLYKGEKTKAYIQDHKEVGSLPLCIFSRQGGGKSTYICNYAKYCTSRNESVFHIDFIKNCEASKSIESAIKDNIILLDFSTEQGLQALAYNEIEFTKDMTWFHKQEWANKKSELTIQLIDAVNENGEPLSPKMSRYLSAACNIIYLNDKASLKEVIKLLQDYQYRENIIRAIPIELKLDLEDDIKALEELNEWSKASKDNPSTIIGTRDAKIEGILDRVSLLIRDFYLKKMYKKDPTNNLNFVKAMEEGKVVLIRMPQSKFKSYVKNVITTFIVTKCWLACEIRGDKAERIKRTHIIIDEVSQTKTAEKYIESVLTQTRKYSLKFVITGQYLDQLDKKTIYSLKGAGASFMLLRGAIKEDFDYLKEEITEEFGYEDLKEMCKVYEYPSFNIIQTSNKTYSFITKLPAPIS